MTPYYQDSHVTIYHGDCREVLPGLPTADLVLTDPPYEAEAHTQQRRVKRGKGVMCIETLGFDSIDEGMRCDAARAITLKVERWALTFCQVEAAMKWRAVYEGAGLVYRRTCIWVKPDGMPQYSGDRPGMGYESIVACHTKGKSEWNGGGRSGVFTFNKADGWTNGAPHLTTKPIRLMTCLIGLFGTPYGITLDPFMGSGSTLRAAKDLNRKAIGIEIEEKYCEIAAKRMAQEVLSL